MIGAGIWTVAASDGFMHRVGYDFLNYVEIEDDWKNFPNPPVEESIILPVDDLGVIFSNPLSPKEQQND